MKIDNKHIIYGQHHYHVIAMLQNTLIKFSLDSGFKLIKFKHSNVNTEFIP